MRKINLLRELEGYAVFNNKIVREITHKDRKRLGLESVEYIRKISKMFSLDKSTAFRNILQKGIQEDKKEKALELYIKGRFSIEQAARFADMYIGEFFELMRQKGIESNLTLDDFDESMKHSRKLDR